MTSIEWTQNPDGSKGKTWNPVRGCVEISPGCARCYAKAFAERWRGLAGHPYEQGFDPRHVPEKLGEPFTWRKPTRVFVNSMSDLWLDAFDHEYVAAVFGVMASCPQHTFITLTKRADRMLDWFRWIEGVMPSAHVLGAARGVRWYAWSEAGCRGAKWEDAVGPAWSGPAPDWKWPLPNLWVGTSVENRKHGVPRIGLLRQVPAAVRVLSIEPLLEDLGDLDLTGIGWVLVGGESGPKARPFDPDWARRILAQCREQRVPCFIKQLGAVPVTGATGRFRTHEGRRQVELVRLRLKDRKGGDMDEWPEDLRVREFPEAQR
jgi:protein gp37